ncbi:hypothetical protein [Acrocarpospora catenulata]|uniref:hypothetical protein n=1 Tax=Acrocarpospora catenulata TaxID=2836182 RepID=UPI001BD93BDC|nr:hypothetical protein [Acrocarpospora catenulata]
MNEFFDTWLKGKQRLKASTLADYEEVIRLYGKPGLGHMKLIAVREKHLTELYAAIRQINRPLEGKPSELLRRLLAARALAPKVHLEEGERPGLKRQKPLTEARLRKIHAILSSAFSTARKHTLITHDPTKHIELPKPKRIRPIGWTDARVARWKATGKIPRKVMVWTPAQCGPFLDTAAERGERLFPSFIWRQAPS